MRFDSRRWGVEIEKETINIKGQKCIVDTYQKILTLRINEAFYSAGKKLNWSFENTVGVGVNPAIFGYCINNGLQLKIQLDNYNYIINNPSKVYRLCKNNHWFWRCGNTHIMVIPLQVLK